MKYYVHGSHVLVKPEKQSFVTALIPCEIPMYPIFTCYAVYDSGGGVTSRLPLPLTTFMDIGTDVFVVTRYISAHIDTTGINFAISAPRSGNAFENEYKVTFEYYLHEGEIND